MAGGNREDFRGLSGMDKASIFLLALGEEASAPVIEQFDDEELREITQNMSALGNVPSSVVERLFLDFVDNISNSGSLVGTHDATEKLLKGALSNDRVNALMDDIRGPAGRNMWDKLGNVHEAVLANYLKNEYPQTVAVILSKIKADHAAKVIALMPENYAMEVVMRMLRMEPVQKEILDNVERTLRTEFMANLANTRRRDNHELIAEIFNNLDRNTESRFLAALEERNRESAEKIKSLMFTFDDLVRVDNAGIQIILRNVPKDKLLISLKGGGEDIVKLFFNNMSERAGKMMKDDMEAMGPIRIRDVDEAQNEIVNQAKALADSGEITISSGTDEDEMIG